MKSMKFRKQITNSAHFKDNYFHVQENMLHGSKIKFWKYIAINLPTTLFNINTEMNYLLLLYPQQVFIETYPVVVYNGYL